MSKWRRTNLCNATQIPTGLSGPITLSLYVNNQLANTVTLKVGWWVGGQAVLLDGIPRLLGQPYATDKVLEARIGS